MAACPRAVDLPQLGGGPTARCLAFRHLAVANTFAALDAKVWCRREELLEAQSRVLLLRQTVGVVVWEARDDGSSGVLNEGEAVGDLHDWG